MRLMVFLIMIWAITAQNLFAQTPAQIMRNLKLPSREEIGQENNNNKVLLREDALKKPKDIAFHIQAPVTCRGTTKPAKEVQDIVDASKITPYIMQNNIFAFALIIEVVNAHLEIMRAFYSEVGIGTDPIFTVRYHSLDELKFYPDTLLEQRLSYSLQSAYYIRYVIFPVLDCFMTEHQKKRFIDIMDTIIPVPPKKYHTLNALDKNITALRTILSEIFVRHIEKTNISINRPRLIVKTINQLFYYAWLAYKNSQSCPYFLRMTDPAVPSYYTDFTQQQVGYDAYQIGYGLYWRATFLTNRYIIKSEQLSSVEKDIIKNNIQNFGQIYGKITDFGKKNISISQLYKTLEDSHKVLLKNF